MHAKYLLTITFLIIFGAAHAQWTTDVNLNTEVKDSIGPEESVPISATTSAGNTFISYFALYNGGYQMRLQLLDANGNRLFGPLGLLVSNQPQNSALFRYDMKVDADDNAVIAFQDERSGSLNVVAYKIDMLGNFLWGANGIQLIDPLSTSGLAPTIGFTNATNVVIGWTSSSSNYKWVSFQKISASGTVQWTNCQTVYDVNFVHKYSRCTFVPAGADDFIMQYAEETGNGLPPSVLYAQRYDATGNPVWAAPVAVSSYTIPFFFFPVAVCDHADGFYVGFNTSNVNFPSQGDVYVQHVDGNGNLWNSTGNLACALSNTQKFTAAVHFDSANNNVWVLIKTTDVNQGMSGLAIQKFDNAGNVMLGANASQLVAISAAYDDPNDFCITNDGVISFYTSGTNFSQTLRAVKNDFSGSLVWGGNPVDICTHLSGKDDLTTGLFRNDQAIAVWDDYRNDYGVYAQNISNSGQPGVMTAIRTDFTGGNISLSIYPNPVADHATLYYNLESCQEISCQVLNAEGEVVISIPGIKTMQGKNLLTLPCSELPAGIYLIKLSSEENIGHQTLIRY